MKLQYFRNIFATFCALFSFITVDAQNQPQNYNPFFIINENSQAQGVTPTNSSASPSTLHHIPGERGCGSGTLSWGANDYQSVPGIYWAYIKSYCHNGIEITIWTDFTPRLFGSNPQAKLQGREIINTNGSHINNMDGSQEITGLLEANATLEYQFSVYPDGDGKGYINGIEYNLQNGTLFLIATKNGDIGVRQVDYNLAYVNSQDIELLATRLPAITSFYGEFHENN